MNNVLEFTREEKLRAVKREIALRLVNYPKWIANGKMSKDQAAHEIDIMRAIAIDYGGHGGQPTEQN